MSESTASSALASKRHHFDRGQAGSWESANAQSNDATEAFIAARIEAAQAALWRAELTRRVLTLIIALLSAGLGWIVLDQWVYSPGPMGRVIAATGLLLATIAYVGWRLWPVMHLRIGEDYAARALERDHVELGHALSSFVSLLRQRDEHPQGQLAQRVIHSVGNSAAEKLRHIDAPPSEATGLTGWWAATIALIGACAIYASASPKNSVQSLARLAVPLASLEAPQRVRITDVSPGDTETLAGRALEIAATVENLRDDEPVYFRWDDKESLSMAAISGAQPTSTSAQDQVRLLPHEAAADPNRFRASVPLSHHAHGRRSYRIIAGDASVGPYQISIRDTPVVQIREVVYDPPAYTKKPRHTSQTGALRGIDGTIVTLIATVNRPISRGVIEFNPRKVGREIRATAGAQEIKVAADGSTIEFTFPLRLRSGAAIPLQDYRLRVWDDAGQTNADPIVYPIEVVEDLPPEINIVLPQQSLVDVPINGQQNFEIHAADVDFGLAEIEIEIRRGIDLIARSSLWKDPAGKQGNQVVEYRFRPSRIIAVNGAASRRASGLNVGDEVEIVAIATDNRFDPNDNTIAPGVSKTQPVRMRITAAAQQTTGDDTEAGDGETGNGETGDGEAGEGEMGDGENGEGEKGEGEKGEGQQGKGEKGEGEKGEGQQGEGQQGKGQQGEGQQGKGQRGDGEQGEMGGGDSRDGGTSGGGGDSQKSEDGDARSDDSQGTDPAADGQPENADANPSETSGSRAGESGEGGGASAGPPTQSPQDDAEAFERIQEYLKQNEGTQDEPTGEQGGGKPNETPNPDQNGKGDGDAKPAQERDQEGQSESASGGDAQQNEKSSSNDESSKHGGESTANPTGTDPAQEVQQPQGGKPGDGQTGEQQTDESGQENGQESGAGASERMNGQNPQTGAENQDADRGTGDDAPAQEGEQEDKNASASDAASDNEGSDIAGDRTNGKERSDGAESTTGAENTDGPESASDAEETSAGDEPGNRQGKEESGRSAEGSPAGSGQQDEGRSGTTEEANEPAQAGRDQNATPGNDQAGGSHSESMKPDSADPSDTDEGLGSAGKPSQPGRAGPSPDASANAKESSQGGGGGQSLEGDGTGESINEDLPDPVDLEYTKAATDMVLDYLDETRADPDPNLLERLKWTEQDLRRFRERWKSVKPIDQGKPSDASANEIEEALRSLGMRPPVTTESTRRDTADSLGSLRDAGNRRPAPAGVRDAFDAFRRGLGQGATDTN